MDSFEENGHPSKYTIDECKISFCLKDKPDSLIEAKDNYKDSKEVVYIRRQIISVACGEELWSIVLTTKGVPLIKDLLETLAERFKVEPRCLLLFYGDMRIDGYSNETFERLGIHNGGTICVHFQ
ncbi:hypothetical protein ACOME3_004082 [Neoechinorhynchus agilis]